MPELSIVISFRNRELSRVQKCLDSLGRQEFKDFELIFIDYGSSDDIAQSVCNLIQNYKFAKYYYAYTSGWVWSRSHALNIGIKYSSGKYILFGDIDFIYDSGCLMTIMQMHRPDSQVCAPFYLLPQNFDFNQSLNEVALSSLPNTGISARGIQLVEKEKLEYLGGYDEYYSIWGVEDRDLYQRLELINVMPIWLDNKKVKVFHQWHSIVSNQISGLFPDKWWDDMNIYYQLNFANRSRNHNGWGKMVKREDRKIFTIRRFSKFEFDQLGDSYYKAQTIIRLLENIQTLKSDEGIELEVIPKIHVQKYPLINKLLRKALNVSVVSKEYLQRLECPEKYFNPYTDLIYVIWHLIKHKSIINDYAFLYRKEGLVIRLCR